MIVEDKYSIHIHHRHRKTGILTNKTLNLSVGDESSLEAQLRTAFAIGKEEGILLHCGETIFYPVSLINLATAASATSCELQSFPLAAMTGNLTYTFPFFNIFSTDIILACRGD